MQLVSQVSIVKDGFTLIVWSVAQKKMKCPFPRWTQYVSRINDFARERAILNIPPTLAGRKHFPPPPPHPSQM